MERVGDGTWRRDTEADGVQTRRDNIHRVTEPLTTAGPAEIVPSSSVRGSLEIHSIATIVAVRPVHRENVVTKSLAANVIVCRLQGAGNRRDSAIEGCLLRRQLPAVAVDGGSEPAGVVGKRRLAG